MENTQASVSNLNLFERFNRWIQESIMVKLFSIGFLVLILLIPSVWIQNMIDERQSRADEVIDEVADKWSGSQKISGPVLVIPFKKHDVVELANGAKEIHESVEKAFFLPEQLDINGTVNPELLHRGIFDAVVYRSVINVKADFNKPDFKSLSIPDEMILWKDAYMVFGLSDLRGISDSLVFTVGNTKMTAEPSNDIGITSINRSDDGTDYSYMTPKEQRGLVSTRGITVDMGWETPESFKGNVDIKLGMNGSRRLDFVPAGKTTSVKISGPWADPSFDGEFLPVTRNLSETEFDATWKVLHFNRPFSQQWIGSDQKLGGADFGLRLLVPVDQYQKSMRTSKYSVLIILLTFISLFLVEITQKVRIHPFQYILIGAALTIYYTLLLSFSEHIGYNWSYIISSFATVVLISLYSTTFLNRRMSVLVSMLLTIFYTFIFVIILQQDFSLLIGSIGLFLIISLLMYFSRKVNWYKEAIASR